MYPGNIVEFQVTDTVIILLAGRRRRKFENPKCLSAKDRGNIEPGSTSFLAQTHLKRGLRFATDRIEEEHRLPAS